MILIAVPVLARPQRAKPLVESVRAATGVPHTIMFLCSPRDHNEVDACRAAAADEVIVVPWLPGSGDYARKINHALRASVEPWLFQAADDLDFHPGWAENALQCAREVSARVVGTNDLGNPRVKRGEHSTHSLVARSYVEEQGTIDRAGLVLHEGYDHSFVDDELIATAKKRGEYVFCRAAEVRHLHPNWTRGPRDDTYDKGEKQFAADRVRFTRRSALWR